MVVVLGARLQTDRMVTEQVRAREAAGRAAHFGVPGPAAMAAFSRWKLASICGLAVRYWRGQSTAVKPIFAASLSVHAGLARWGRATAHRSARPAAMMLLTWSASEIAPTAMVAMPTSLRMRSAKGVWYMRP